MSSTPINITVQIYNLVTTKDYSLNNKFSKWLYAKNREMFNEFKCYLIIQLYNHNRMINEKLVKHLTKKNNIACTKPEFELSKIDILDFSFTSIPREAKSDWLMEILELETFFQNIENPSSNIKLNQCTLIVDFNKFITSHIAILKANNGNITFLPFLERLRELKNIIENLK